MKTENIEDIYELTPIQKGILFHSIYDTDSQLYLFQVLYTIESSFDMEIFETAWQIVVDRHTILRTGFYWEEVEKELQVVYKQVKLTINHYDWGHLEKEEQENQLESFIASDRSKSFDLSKPCPMRLSLIRLADDKYYLIVNSHFIINDGWTDILLTEEVVRIYAALSHNKEIPLAPAPPYKDYINWLKQKDIAKTEIFWRQALQGIKKPTSIAYLEKTQPSSIQEQRYDEEKLRLTLQETKNLKSFAIQNRLTLASIFNGIWTILLSRYTGQDEVLYGCTANGRPVDLKGIEAMAGLFLNTLPIYVKIDVEQPLLLWLKQIQTQLLAARRYEYTPLTDIHGWSEVPRNLNLFESVVVMEDFSVKRLVEDLEMDLKIKYCKTYYKNNYPLNLVIYPDDKLFMAFSYHDTKFSLDTIKGILKDIYVTLQQLIANPNIRIKDLSFLTSEQEQNAAILESEASFDWDFALSV
ncbi:MAG: condensation domain-containing protein [Cyanobacteria bacterium P01_F01_bin.143]